MKSFGYTYIFAAIVAALVGYTVYDQKQTLKSEAAKLESEKIITLKPGDVAQIRVALPSETFVIKHENNQWSLAEPLVDQVEEEAANNYLDSMLIERATPVIQEKRVEIKWANYNLEPPGAAVEITKLDGTKLSFSVSRMAAFDGSYFLRRGDELLLGSTGWAKVIDKGSAQIRSKKIFREAGTVVKIRIENSHKDNNDKFTLVRKEDKSWQIVESPSFEIDQEKVQKYIDDFKTLRALEYAIEKPAADTRKKYSINTLVSKVTMDFEEKKSAWVAEIGSEKAGAHFGVSSSVDAIFKLSAYDGEQMRRDRNYFRNGKAPFKFPVEQANEIRVKSDANQWTFKKDGTTWKLADPQANSTANTQSLEQLVEKIATLEAKEFLVNAKAAKMNGTKQIEFRATDGKPLLNLSFGETYAPQSGPNKGSQLVYAKSSLTPETLAVAAGDLSAIPFDQLVTVAAVQPAAAQSEKK